MTNKFLLRGHFFANPATMFTNNERSIRPECKKNDEDTSSVQQTKTRSSAFSDAGGIVNWHPVTRCRHSKINHRRSNAIVERGPFFVLSHKNDSRQIALFPMFFVSHRRNMSGKRMFVVTETHKPAPHPCTNTRSPCTHTHTHTHHTHHTHTTDAFHRLTKHAADTPRTHQLHPPSGLSPAPKLPLILHLSSHDRIAMLAPSPGQQVSAPRGSCPQTAIPGTVAHQPCGPLISGLGQGIQGPSVEGPHVSQPRRFFGRQLGLLASIAVSFCHFSPPLPGRPANTNPRRGAILKVVRNAHAGQARTDRSQCKPGPRSEDNLWHDGTIAARLAHGAFALCLLWSSWTLVQRSTPHGRPCRAHPFTYSETPCPGYRPAGLSSVSAIRTRRDPLPTCSPAAPTLQRGSLPPVAP